MIINELLPAEWSDNKDDDIRKLVDEIILKAPVGKIFDFYGRDNEDFSENQLLQLREADRDVNDIIFKVGKYLSRDHQRQSHVQLTQEGIEYKERLLLRAISNAKSFTVRSFKEYGYTTDDAIKQYYQFKTDGYIVEMPLSDGATELDYVIYLTDSGKAYMRGVNVKRTAINYTTIEQGKVVVGNNYGQLNTILGNNNNLVIGDIENNINVLNGKGNEEVANALRELTGAITTSTTLDKDKKVEVIEQVQFLASEAIKTDEKRSPKSIIKSVLNSVKTATDVISATGTLYGLVKTICLHFNIPLPDIGL